jgi:hypothetical protein
MEKQTFNYDGLFNLSSLSFNTVQGLNLDSGFHSLTGAQNEKGKYTSIKTTFNYGFQKSAYESQECLHIDSTNRTMQILAFRRTYSKTIQ